MTDDSNRARAAALRYLDGRRTMNEQEIVAVTHPHELTRYARENEIARAEARTAYAAYVRDDWECTELETFGVAGSAAPSELPRYRGTTTESNSVPSVSIACSTSSSIPTSTYT